MNTITAQKGKWLTQKGEVSVKDRIMVKSVSGYSDLESLYRTANEEEYEEWLQVQNALAEATEPNIITYNGNDKH